MGGAAGTGLVHALQHYTQVRNAALIAARKELRIGELDARALLFIADHPSTRPTALREHLGITSAGVTTLVDRLTERGAVRRDLDPDDRRVNRLTVTVDLMAEPWSALTRFDRAFAAAVDAADTTGGGPTSAQLAAALDRFTSVAAERRA